MKKNYHLDTCTLLEQENTIEILRNGEENNIFISMTVINEIDNLLKSKKRYLAMSALHDIWNNKEHVTFVGDIKELNNDDHILDDVKDKDHVLVTNDKLLHLKAYIKGIKSENFKITNPFLNESEKYTGFVNENDEKVNNCFYFKEGKLFQWINNEEKFVNHTNKVWEILPKNIYQNAAMELLLNNDIKIVTIQSLAGKGKSFLSLATALKLVFEKKLYSKIYIIKYPSEIGEDIGYLPGSVEQKLAPYWRPLLKLLLKLYQLRNFRKGITEEKLDGWPILNPNKIEFLPVNYLRGENIEQSVIIISEAQNITRHDMRTILTRMGENVKVIIEGDISQIDNPNCNQNNNALNWIVKCLKDNPKYGHVTIKGNDTRGEICKMILDSDF
jgi:PhoH-like ATPase